MLIFIDMFDFIEFILVIWKLIGNVVIEELIGYIIDGKKDDVEVLCWVMMWDFECGVLVFIVNKVWLGLIFE